MHILTKGNSGAKKQNILYSNTQQPREAWAFVDLNKSFCVYQDWTTWML